MTAGTWNPLRQDPSPAAGFYDAQVRAWFDGRWDVPLDEVSLEAFVIENRNYIYFGPVPALLRVPVLAVSDLDQRLTGISMCAAFVALLTGATALSWRVRLLVRGPGTDFSRTDTLAAILAATTVGGGSTVLYLASATWAYQEALLWAVAFTLWSFVHLLDHLARPSLRSLAAASILAAAAFGCRGSVGIAPVVALAAVAGGVGVRWIADRGAPGAALLRAPGRWLRVPEVGLAASLISVLVPVATYAGVNVVKFGSLFRLPVDRQIYINQMRPARVEALAANGGSLFGVQFLPTNLVHYLRPDAFDLSRVFPFFTPPLAAPNIIGKAVFDNMEPAASLTSTTPLLVAFAVVGVFVAVRGRSVPGATGPAPVRALLLGGGAATMAGLCIAWNTQRYQGDFLPLLLVAGLVGLHHFLVPRGVADDASHRRGRRRVALGAALAVVVGSVYLNLAVGLFYQRLLWAPAEMRADFVGFQQDLDERLFGDRPPVRVSVGGPELPSGARTGDLFVVDDCAGLYLAGVTFNVADSSARNWLAVERTAGTGGFRLRLDFPEVLPVRPEPLLVSGSPGNRSVIAVDYPVGDPGHARLSLGIEATGDWWRGEPFAFDPDEPQTFDVVFDRRTLQVRVTSGDDLRLVSTFWRPEPDPQISVGDGGFEPMTTLRFSGELVDEPLDTPVCDGILRRLRDQDDSPVAGPG